MIYDIQKNNKVSTTVRGFATVICWVAAILLLSGLFLAIADYNSKKISHHIIFAAGIVLMLAGLYFEDKSRYFKRYEKLIYNIINNIEEFSYLPFPVYKPYYFWARIFFGKWFDPIRDFNIKNVCHISLNQQLY